MEDLTECFRICVFIQIYLILFTACTRIHISCITVYCILQPQPNINNTPLSWNKDYSFCLVPLVEKKISKTSPTYLTCTNQLYMWLWGLPCNPLKTSWSFDKGKNAFEITLKYIFLNFVNGCAIGSRWVLDM